MSHSRAERRRRERGGNAPPPRRDPMIPIYVGLAVVIVLVFAGFGLAHYIQNRQSAQAIAFESSTPTPGPKASTKAIQIQNGERIGTPGILPTPNPQRGVFTDTTAGGTGQNVVDGMSCETQEEVTLHVHSHLSLFVSGKQIQIPPYVGIMLANPTTVCLYWLHTHDATGIIHVEAGSPSAPSGGPYTLGMFFDVWGEALAPNQIGPFQGHVTAFVNGAPYSGNLRNIPLTAHKQITLEVGSPVVPPPNYRFPIGD